MFCDSFYLKDFESLIGSQLMSSMCLNDIGRFTIWYIHHSCKALNCTVLLYFSNYCASFVSLFLICSLTGLFNCNTSIFLPISSVRSMVCLINRLLQTPPRLQMMSSSIAPVHLLILDTCYLQCHQSIQTVSKSD